MTSSITKMKLMLLALCFTFTTSQEESISPYEGMLQRNRCPVCVRSLKHYGCCHVILRVSMVQIRSSGLQDFRGRIL